MIFEILKRILMFLIFSGISTYITYNLTWDREDQNRKKEAVSFFTSYVLGAMLIYGFFEYSSYRQDLFFMLVIALNLLIYKTNHIIAMLNSIIVFIIFNLGELLVVLASSEIDTLIQGMDGSMSYLLTVQIMRFILAITFKSFLMDVFSDFTGNIDLVKKSIRNRITISVVTFYIVTNIIFRALLIKGVIIIRSPLVGSSIPIFIAILFLALIVSYIDIINRFVESKSQYKKIKGKYMVDDMTGALTKEEGIKRVEKLVSNGEKIELVFIDVDNLKKINDEHGHIKGDNCIKLIAKIIMDNIRSEDVFFRFGGDEFIIVFVGIERQLVGDIIGRINKTVENSDNCGICTGISYGIAEKLDRSLDEIIASADKSMYENKKLRKSKKNSGEISP